MTTASSLTKREVEQDEGPDADDGGARDGKEADDERDDEGGRTLDEIIDSYAGD